MMENINVKNLPVTDRFVADLETLEAELAMANKRVGQAIRRRDEILDQMLGPVRQKAIRDLERRGIILGKTRVIVSQRGWRDNAWEYKEAFVTDVNVEPCWGGSDDAFDLNQLEPRIGYKFALVRKNGTASKAGTGIYSSATIERIA